MDAIKSWLGRSGLASVAILAVLLLVVFPLAMDTFRLNLVGKYLTYGFVAVALGGALCFECPALVLEGLDLGAEGEVSGEVHSLSCTLGPVAFGGEPVGDVERLWVRGGHVGLLGHFAAPSIFAARYSPPARWPISATR